MAFTSLAAVVAGGASTVVTLAAIAEVGLALTVVGAVTGSKDLMKLGSVMGIVGGVGGAIAGAVGGAATGAAGDALSTTVMDAANSGAAAESFASGLDATVGDALTNTAASQAGGLADATLGQGFTPGASGQMGGQSVQTASTAATTAGNTVKAVAPDANTVIGAQGPSAVSNPFDTPVGAQFEGGNLNLGGAPTSSNSWWSSLGDKTQEAIIKSGTGLLQGASQSQQAADRLALDRDRLALQSYGSEVPRGIVNSARTA